VITELGRDDGTRFLNLYDEPLGLHAKGRANNAQNTIQGAAGAEERGGNTENITPKGIRVDGIPLRANRFIFAVMIFDRAI
jgi:hypothetical protein